MTPRVRVDLTPLEATTLRVLLSMSVGDPDLMDGWFPGKDGAALVRTLEKLDDAREATQ